MVITVLKQTFRRSYLMVLVYRDGKIFDKFTFKIELEKKMNQQIDEYKHFKQIFLEVWNTHASIKRELLRANDVPHMTKALRKVIMKRSKLENRYEKRRKVKTLNFVKKQKNFCSKLYRRSEKSIMKGSI